MTRQDLTKTQLLGCLFGALIAAVLVFVALILPAEYSIDPLGTGKYLGLVGLGVDSDTLLYSEDCDHIQDRRVFELAPFESVEYSYHMRRDALFVFSWQASSVLHYNLHGTVSLPGRANFDTAKSSGVGAAAQQQGRYRAPFDGRHGWFWENRTDENQSLELVVAGFVEDGEQTADNFFERYELPSVLSTQAPGCERSL